MTSRVLLVMSLSWNRAKAAQHKSAHFDIYCICSNDTVHVLWLLFEYPNDTITALVSFFKVRGEAAAFGSAS